MDRIEPRPLVHMLTGQKNYPHDHQSHTHGMTRVTHVVEKEMVEKSKRRLEVLKLDDTDDITCATFIMHDEDHTLGNALRWILIKNPDVSFCGYSVPHPSEKCINLRIQTHGAPAIDVLREGLEDLRELYQHIHTTFQAAVANHKSDKPMEMEH